MARTAKMTSAEKYERQKELARERQRKRRAKLSEEQLEMKRKYDRDRREKLKKENKLKKVCDMTPREHRKMKKYWRERNKIRKLKNIALAEAIANTPPGTPTGSPERNGREESSQRKRGRKQVRKSKAKVYRTVKKQEEQIKVLQRRLEKYKKRLYRTTQKLKTTNSPSPKKQVLKVVGHERVSPQVKKQLFLGFALQKQIEDQKKAICDSKKKTQQMHKFIGNKMLKKYRVQTYFRDLVPYKSNKVLSEDTCKYSRKEKKGIRQILSKELIRFFEDDRISRMCPGKKDVVKKGSIKKQRRILLEPLKTLHVQFQDEIQCKISLASFLRARPFWVTLPKKTDRETCGCIKHSNMDLIVNALKQTKLIKEKNPTEVVKSIVCSPNNEECMMNRCENCKDKEVVFSYDTDFKIKFYQWKHTKEERLVKNTLKKVQKTVKIKNNEYVSKIKSEFHKQIIIFKKHVFYTKHQSKQLKEKIENLQTDELAFRIDFSENYVCKYEKEIQSVHFGASKRQIALNTGLIYFTENGEIKNECFASVSDNLDHQAHAVWGHMIPILKHYSSRFPTTKIIHFFSDGPSNQYRNRFNIKLFETVVPLHFQRVIKMTWNYTEAGHGKGPMDGVGGTLKREADRKVLYGNDITCAKDFFNAMTGIKVLLMEIPSKHIEIMKRKVASLTIPPISGIMQVHQVTFSQGVMFARSLSCFQCPPSQYCDHFTLSEIFPDNSPKEESDKDIDDNLDVEDDIFTPNKIKNAKLSIDDVYSSSEDESLFNQEPSTSNSQFHSTKYKQTNKAKDLQKHLPLVVNKPQLEVELGSGVYVLVRYENDSKKLKTRDFIGVCQSNVINKEIEVMFLKNCTKDNSLYYMNEKDVAIVQLEQILAVLQTPSISLKGNRVFYKFILP